MDERTAPPVLAWGPSLAHERAHAIPARAVACVVVPAWVASRLVAALALAVIGSTPRGTLDLDALTSWDSNWYLRIAQHGYGPSHLPTPWQVGPAHWTTWPFFPLHPALARVLMTIGVPDRGALLVVNNAAFFVALIGLHRLARRHVGEAGAAYAVWIMALFPGSITSVMGYSGGLFAAGSVWAFARAEERRYGLAGAAMLAAASSRPNGALVLIALVPMAIGLARRSGDRPVRAALLVAGPSAAFLAAWCGWCARVTGDPLVFLHAKRAWDEVTLVDFLHHPLAGNSTVHIFLALVALMAVGLAVRRLPRTWLVLVVVALGPSLVLGVTGLGRYAAEAFPVSIALASVLTRVPRVLVAGYFVASAAGLMIFGSLVTHARYVP